MLFNALLLGLFLATRPFLVFGSASIFRAGNTPDDFVYNTLSLAPRNPARPGRQPKDSKQKNSTSLDTSWVNAVLFAYTGYVNSHQLIEPLASCPDYVDLFAVSKSWVPSKETLQFQPALKSLARHAISKEPLPQNSYTTANSISAALLAISRAKSDARSTALLTKRPIT